MYKDAMDRPPPPSGVAIATMTEERVNIYQNVPPPREPIPVGDLPFLVDNTIPEDEEIGWAVRRLGLNRLGSPLGMRV